VAGEGLNVLGPGCTNSEAELTGAARPDTRKDTRGVPAGLVVPELASGRGEARWKCRGVTEGQKGGRVRGRKCAWANDTAGCVAPGATDASRDCSARSDTTREVVICQNTVIIIKFF